MPKLSTRLFVAALFVLSFAPSTFAGPARELDRRIGQILETLPKDGKVTLRDVSLGRESLDTIELETMEVWAKDAKIIEYGAGGKETILAPPDVKYFKGTVKGESESAVFFSRSANGSIRGMVVIGSQRWVIGSGIRVADRPIADIRKDREMEAPEPNAPLLLTKIDEVDDLLDPATFECGVGVHVPDMPLVGSSNLRTGLKKPVTESGNVAGATYQLRIAVETDNELAAAFSNDSEAIDTYIGDLIAKASIVYSRDLKTTLVLGEVHKWTDGPNTDPWTTTNKSAALAEFGTYWHTHYPLASVPRSAAIFVSGRIFNGGIAWVDILCNDDFFCGADGSNCNGGTPSPTYANAYAGPYAFNGSITPVTTTVPDPTLTISGVQYRMPTSSNFWMLYEVMHELGHNVASRHSSCIGLTAEEKVLYGVTRNFVDICLTGEGGCYSGTVSAPAELGTIMSYCQNVPGPQSSRYIFGKAGEASEKMLPIFHDGLEGGTPDPTITVQSPPVACAAGRTASVPACSGCTYQWTIDGGVITSAGNIAAIVYTPNASSVTVGVTVITARGCGISSSKTFLASCVPVDPPTNVVATATSTSNVQVSWSASVGATTYNVYRSTDGVTYGLAGFTTAPTTVFSDSGRTANTAYLYKVRAVNGGESADSNRDLATTVIFTDDPIVASTTQVKATHITQLRTAVNAVRALASLAAGSYTDPTITVGATLVKAVHINDLRTALNAARSNLSLSAISYGETVTASTTTVKTTHVSELRNGVK